MLVSTNKTDAVRFQWFATHCQNWESHGHQTILTILHYVFTNSTAAVYIIMITSADARPGTERKITVPGRFYTVKTKFTYNDVYINNRIRHFTLRKQKVWHWWRWLPHCPDGRSLNITISILSKIVRWPANVSLPSMSLQNAVRAPWNTK